MEKTHERMKNMKLVSGDLKNLYGNQTRIIT